MVGFIVTFLYVYLTSHSCLLFSLPTIPVPSLPVPVCPCVSFKHRFQREEEICNFCLSDSDLLRIASWASLLSCQQHGQVLLCDWQYSTDVGPIFSLFCLLKSASNMIIGYYLRSTELAHRSHNVVYLHFISTQREKIFHHPDVFVSFSSNFLQFELCFGMLLISA